MKIKEHVEVQNNGTVKSPGPLSFNLSLRNLYLLGCIFGLIMGLISVPYLRSSFRTAIDDGKSSPMIQNVKPSSSYQVEVSLESKHSAERSDSICETVNRDSRMKKVKSEEQDEQAPSTGCTSDRVSSQASKGQKLDKKSVSGKDWEVEEQEEGEADTGADNLHGDTTQRIVDTDKKVEEAETTVVRETANEDVVRSDINMRSVEGVTERDSLHAEASDSSARPSPSMRVGTELRNQSREDPVLTGVYIENAPLATDQKLGAIDTGEEGSVSKDSETDLRQKTSEEGDGLEFLSSDPSRMTSNSTKHPGVVLNSPQRDQCNIFSGQWIPDPLGPLYPSNSCRVLTRAQNCQDNGRPDKDYEFYKWQPQDCDLPRMDPLAFLKFMEGKTLAFIGDSVARNQYESLMCILSQVAQPKNRGNKHMQRWLFPSHRFTLIRIWSGWLVRQSKEPFSFAPKESVKLFLDQLDDFANNMPGFDAAVISSGHWWMRQSAYVLGGKIRGGYGWSANIKSKKIDQGQAFAIAMKNVLKKMAQIPNYKGLTIFRTYSPDHYEGGRWDTGGSCTGKTKPYERDQLPTNTFSQMMRAKQMDAIKSVTQTGGESRNGSSLALLDVFEALNFRADGHPGPYRSRNPTKQTQRDEKGHPPPQDCLHWCMPGPVDTMNLLLFEVLKRESRSNETLRFA